MPAYSNNVSSLDKIRLGSGANALKAHFHNLLENDEGKAVNSINEKNLFFPSLYLLQAEINKYGLQDSLTPQNQHALNIVNGILTNNLALSENLAEEQKQLTNSTLKWMFETGWPDDGLNDQFDEIMDVTAILLIKIFKTTSNLKILLDMIFNRYRRGALIHDLVWAYFEARSPESLTLIADRLRSNNWKDIELSKKLLNFIPGLDGNTNREPGSQHSAAVSWIKENQPYLYFTGESMQQSMDPRPYAVSMESKYLNKNLSNNRSSLPGPLLEDESAIIDRFNALDDADRLLLADCSYKLRRRNMRQWNAWIRYPLDRQITMAKAIMGGLS